MNPMTKRLKTEKRKKKMILDLGIERETSRPPAPRNSAYLFVKIIFIIVIIIMCMAVIMMTEMLIFRIQLEGNRCDPSTLLVPLH